MVVNTSWQVIRLLKFKRLNCLHAWQKFFEFERINHKKSSAFCTLWVFQKTKPMTPRYHCYYRFFNRSLCHVPESLYHRWTCSPVTVRIRFGLMNLFRPKSSQGIILLSICWLTPTVSSLKEYRTKKIESWSLLLLFVLETITDYSLFWKIVNRNLCTKMYTGYLRHENSWT